MNSQGSEIGRFWAKSLGFSTWYWLTEWVIVSLLLSRSVTSSARDRASAWRTGYLTLVPLPCPAKCETPTRNASVRDWLNSHEPRWWWWCICILCQKWTGWMFLLPVFRVNWCFFRWSPFIFDTLERSHGDMPPSMMSEGDCGEVLEQQPVFVVPPVSGDHRVIRCLRSSSYFLPTVRIYLNLSRVLKVEICERGRGEGGEEGWGREVKCKRCYSMQIFSLAEVQHFNTSPFTGTFGA